ncbi:MAG: hypothetical protein ABJP70_11435 [Erythrobacter sp.]
MSNAGQTGASRLSSAQSTRFAGLKRRAPFYVAAVLVFVLGLAWFDGGLEPLHPISQSIDIASLE